MANVVDETNTLEFNPGIVAPYLTLPYMSMNKITISRFLQGNWYNSHDYVNAWPITKLLHHSDSAIEFDGTGDVPPCRCFYYLLPPGAMSIITPFTDVYAGHFRLRWIPTGGDAWTYEIYYRILGDPAYTLLATTTETSLDLSGITAGTYQWYIVATNPAGSSTSSATTTIVLDADPIYPGSPVYLSPGIAEDGLGTSITFSWIDSGQRQKPTWYRLHIADNPLDIYGQYYIDLTDGEEEVTIGPGEFTFVDGTTYYFCVLSDGLITPDSTSRMFICGYLPRDLNSAPHEVQYDAPDNNATGMPKTGFNLDWQMHPHYGGIPTSYTVYLSDNYADPYGQEAWTVVAPTSQLNPVVDEGYVFNPGTTYYWTVQAHNAFGDSALEAPRKFKISSCNPPVGAPLLVSPVAGGICTTKGIVLSWTRSYGGVDPTYYQVSIIVNGVTHLYITSLTSFHTAIDAGLTLQHGDTIQWKVSAFNSISEYEQSALRTFYCIDFQPVLTSSDTDYRIPWMIAQWHNSQWDAAIPEYPGYDILSDVCSGIMKAMKNCMPDVAYAMLLAFNLLSRIATDEQVHIGGKPSIAQEFTPYGL